MGCGRSIVDVKPAVIDEVKITVNKVDHREEVFKQYLHEAAELKLHKEIQSKVATLGTELNTLNKMFTIGEIDDQFEKSHSKHAMEEMLHDVPVSKSGDTGSSAS